MDAYYRPGTLDDGLRFLAEGPAIVAAGCTDLFPATDRRALAGRILDITGIDALRGIETGPDHIRIGAGVTWSRLVATALPPGFDMLKAAGREVGSAQIQNAGTLAGNLCNASPAADGVPCLLALDAAVELTGAEGRRTLPLAEFIAGPRRTALRPGEMMTAILVPRPSAEGASRFLKLGARRYLVISIAMVAMRLDFQAGRVAHAAAAVGACGPVATRLPLVESALAGRPADPGLAEAITAEAVAPALSPIDDIRADAAYRVDAAVTLLRRAAAELAGGAA